MKGCCVTGSSTITELDALRTKHYNATIVQRVDIHEGLARFRIRPDAGFAHFDPGQYVAIGLGNWEPRLPDCQEEVLDEKKQSKLTRRAYSISCPLVMPSPNPTNVDPVPQADIDETATIKPAMVTVNQIDYLEFYIALVKFASTDDGKPPSLTPRLFKLRENDRVEVQKKIVGTYVLENVKPTDTVLMISTGTGEAPHNAMATELLAAGHVGNVINVTTVRTRLDLGYLAEHRWLEEQYSNYKYLFYTTREVENLDSSHPEFVGKQYVQDLFSSGTLAQHADDPLSPTSTHVFLCGNPSMIGYTPPGADPPTVPGMLQVLKQAGFVEVEDNKKRDRDQTGDSKVIDQDGPGTIRFEKYW
jgi:ferredoxin--NADP+ reductase